MAKVTISKDVFESISTIFQAGRVSGICPLGVIRNANRFSLFWSKKILIYSYFSVSLLGMYPIKFPIFFSQTFFLGISVCCSIYGLVQNYKIKEIHSIRFRTVTGTICSLSENISLLFSCSVGTILAPFLQHHFFKYLECLREVCVPSLTLYVNCFCYFFNSH